MNISSKSDSADTLEYQNRISIFNCSILALGVLAAAATFFFTATCAMVFLSGSALVTALCIVRVVRATKTSCIDPPADSQSRSCSKVGIGVGTAALVISLSLFWYGIEWYPLAWKMYAGGMVVLVTSCVGFKKPDFNLHTYFAASLIFGIGIFLRFYHIFEFPFGVFFDEAQNILMTSKIMTDPNYRPIFIGDLTQLAALTFYYYIPFIYFGGDDVVSIRIASALIGILAVGSTWLLARELFNRSTALIAAALMATCRWQLAFSRFGIAHIFATLFAPLVLYYFIKSQRRSSLGDAILAGISLGIGLQTYYSLLGFPLVLLAVFGCRWLMGEKTSLRLFAVTALTAVLVYSPVILYAVSNWDGFSQRLSVVSGISPVQVMKALWHGSAADKEVLATFTTTLTKHVQMFHINGDFNGRHNIPYLRMLEPIIGTLFAIGMCLTVVSLRSWRHSALLLSFGMFFCAALFSLPLEAPQGARSLGLTPFLCIIAALPLAAVANLLRGRLTTPLVVTVIYGILTAVAFQSFDVWRAQLTNRGVWVAYGADQTKVAELSNALNVNTLFIVSEYLSGGPTVTLLAKSRVPLQPFSPSMHIPMSCHVPAAVFALSANEIEWIKTIQRVYPGATVKEFGTPTDKANPLLYIVELSAENILGICLRNADSIAPDRTVWIRRRQHRGSNGSDGWFPFMSDTGESAFPVTAKTIASIPPNDLIDIYSPETPLGGLSVSMISSSGKLVNPGPRTESMVNRYFHFVPAAPPFTKTWSGYLKIEEAGSYDMRLVGRDSFSMWIDNMPVIASHGAGDKRITLPLTQGKHTVRLALRFETGAYSIAWLWRRTGDPNIPMQVVPSSVLEPIVIGEEELRYVMQHGPKFRTTSHH